MPDIHVSIPFNVWISIAKTYTNYSIGPQNEIKQNKKQNKSRLQKSETINWWIIRSAQAFYNRRDAHIWAHARCSIWNTENTKQLITIIALHASVHNMFLLLFLFTSIFVLVLRWWIKRLIYHHHRHHPYDHDIAMHLNERISFP